MIGAMKCAVVAMAIGLAYPALATAQSADQLRSQAFDEAYSLDHAQATRTMDRALRLAPQDPGLHRSLATIAWLEMLFARGTVTVDDYLGPVSGTDTAVEPPPAALVHTFKTSVERAIALADTTVAARPHDAEAWYQLGAALGLQASYVATVEGRVLGGLRAARRAYDAEERALSLSPARTDAGLIVGTYRYVVSGLSLPLRLMAYMAGFGGGKTEGLSYVEHAASTSSDAQVDAQFALVLLYNREERYADALGVLRRLKQRFPRNRLLWLEEGATALRGANTEQADMVLTTGLSTFSREDRPRAPGELALWHYKRAVARRVAGRATTAADDLTMALGLEPRPWVRGRIALERARLARAARDGKAAEREYTLAVDTCVRAKDSPCESEARSELRALPRLLRPTSSPSTPKPDVRP